MAFFPLSGPDLGSGPGICVPQAATAREEQAQLRTRVRHLARPLLRYFAAVLSARPFELCF
jgi:hypothetical protein